MSTTQRMDSFLGGDMMAVVNSTFECMDLAEEVITASGCTYAQNKSAFGVMCPTPPLRGKSHDVYRAHARELVERIIAGKDTRPGTRCEVLCCLLATALKAPLNQSGGALAEHLFAELFPRHQVSKASTRRQEFYKGQIAEDLADARKRCAVADRVAS